MADPSGVCRKGTHENSNNRGFRQTPAALRGVMSRLITRFAENGEILDLIKAEYRAGCPLPAVEKAVAARIEPGEALPHTLAKAQRDHLWKIRGV
jgi:hypothetical protein